MWINDSYKKGLALEDIKISRADLIASIQEWNEYVLSSLDWVIEKQYHYKEWEVVDERKEYYDIESLQKYLDEKVKYWHINRREESWEIIYYPSTEEQKEAILSAVRFTKEEIAYIHSI